MMAMSGRSTLCLLNVVLVVLFLGTCAQALEIVNKRGCELVVFAPPFCEPCACQQIQCIRAPCEQPPCFCPKVCKIAKGVVVKAGKTVALPLVQKEKFPLQYLRVEIGKLVYVVAEADLKVITRVATVVVTTGCCGKGKEGGIVAIVYPNPKFVGSTVICLVLGERYGK